MTTKHKKKKQPLTQSQRRLQRRQLQQILSRKPREWHDIRETAAVAFLPGNHQLAFDSPFRPLGTAVMVVLSRHPSPRRKDGIISYLRGYTAVINPETAVTTWGPQGARFAYDLGLKMFPHARMRILPLQNETLATLALDMDRACFRGAKRPEETPGLPPLVTTVLGYPAGTKFEPEATAYVQDATRRKFKLGPDVDVTDDPRWMDVWHELHDEWTVPEELRPRTSQNSEETFELIDTRLCTRIRGSLQRSGAIRSFHDFRPFLAPYAFREDVDWTQDLPLGEARHIRNPARDAFGKVPMRRPNPAKDVLDVFNLTEAPVDDVPKMQKLSEMMVTQLGVYEVFFGDEDIILALQNPNRPVTASVKVSPKAIRDHHDAAAVAKALRAEMDPQLAQGCSDIDLDFAAQSPDRPLVASMLPKIQLFQFLGDLAFTDTCNLVDMDLWAVKDNWMDFLYPPTVRKERARNDTPTPAPTG